jgi:hypothetical protein
VENKARRPILEDSVNRYSRALDIHTAGYTGQAGGTAGPGTRRAETSLIHVTNPEWVGEKIIGRVRTRRSSDRERMGPSRKC